MESKKFTDLNLNPAQQKEVVEWLAYQYRLILLGLNVADSVGYKTYDPLTIEGNVAHSYVFDLEDGGRHHEFTDYDSLVDSLTNEVIRDIFDELPEILENNFIVR